MKTFKKLILPCLLLIFSISMVGCIASWRTQPSPATSGVVLSLRTPKAAYASQDAISLELSIQNGTSDLLIPLVNVETSGAFAQLKVTDANGDIVEPKRVMRLPSSQEIFIEKDGSSVQCIQGFELKAEATRIVSLEDLQKYYQLQKGNYTVALTMTLPVYREFLKKPHPEVIALEEEMRRIQKVTDAHVSAADKRSAVNDIQEQIEFLQKKDKEIYLPVKSLFGEASLAANSVTLTIE